MIILGTLSDFNFAPYTMYYLRMVLLLQLNFNDVYKLMVLNLWYFTGDIYVNV